MVGVANAHPAAAPHLLPLRLPGTSAADARGSAAAARPRASARSLGFPLDDLSHRFYGEDVTMWSATHVLMIGGATFYGPALLLGVGADLRRHGRRVPRVTAVALGGVTLATLSALQLEYDLGIPQWQLLYQPVIVAIAGGVALVAARRLGGPGAALGAVLVFLGAAGGAHALAGRRDRPQRRRARAVPHRGAGRRGRGPAHRRGPGPWVAGAGGRARRSARSGWPGEAVWVGLVAFAHPWNARVLEHAWLLVAHGGAAAGRARRGAGPGRVRARGRAATGAVWARSGVCLVALAVPFHRAPAGRVASRWLTRGGVPGTGGGDA